MQTCLWNFIDFVKWYTKDTDVTAGKKNREVDTELHHTWGLGESKVQVLTKARRLPHVYKMLSPNQAPWCVAHSSSNAQVGIGICQTRAIVAAVSCTLVEAFVLDVQELVRNLHPRQGHEMISPSAFKHFLWLTSYWRVKNDPSRHWHVGIGLVWSTPYSHALN